MTKSTEDESCYVYKRFMCHYFSLGIDSRIGLGFDKKRTKQRCCNKMRYFYEGVKKILCCCTKTLKIKDVVDYVTTLDEEGKE